MGSRGDVSLGYRGESFVVVVDEEVSTGRAGGGDKGCNCGSWFRRGCYSWYQGFCCGRYGCLGFGGRYGYGLCGGVGVTAEEPIVVFFSYEEMTMSPLVLSSALRRVSSFPIVSAGTVPASVMVTRISWE